MTQTTNSIKSNTKKQTPPTLKHDITFKNKLKQNTPNNTRQNTPKQIKKKFINQKLNPNTPKSQLKYSTYTTNQIHKLTKDKRKKKNVKKYNHKIKKKVQVYRRPPYCYLYIPGLFISIVIKFE